ncbi:putative oxidoreductase [Chryseobacterium sp. H1D6B]|uniref:DoxX family membrane protein n=1 Tax=Chryseobacterium sp. H1D6B TaxID=2940588 RepID=UPI0015C7304C|nr:DoxX family membrane protein [Chryseobacterium sp. H1D6B]MDH6251400.1 putative oxidoreductase [Chryseobacterium sp. H1D6B]
MKIVKFILCLLFGLMFINAGLDKFLHYMPMPQLTEVQKKIFGAFMELGWLMPLVGTVEIVGGLLFIFPKTRALGAIIILPVMVGIVLHNAYRDPSSMGITISLVLFLINLWIIADNRGKYKALIS